MSRKTPYEMIEYLGTVNLPETGKFLVPLCISRDELLVLMSAAFEYAYDQKNGFDASAYTPLIQAINYINDLSHATCFTDKGDCTSYPSSSSIIGYYPQNPFSEVGLVPSGYLTSPFTRWADFIPLVPNWLQNWLSGAISDLTGYLPDDVIVDISSFPLTSNWQDIINGVFPQISITVSGVGIAELHLINFPLGGRALISVDTQPNIADIFLGIFGNSEQSVELNRDLISLPIETPSISIQEIEIAEAGNHTIYITFVPTIDDASIPINFGGGLRKVVLCGLDTVIMPIVEDVRINNCNLEKMINGQWIIAESLLDCVTPLVNSLQSQISSNAFDINVLGNRVTFNEGAIADLITQDVSLQNQITSNNDDILALQATAGQLQNQITSNNDDIAALQLDAQQQALSLQDHLERIIALEAASGSGGGGGNIKTTALTYLVNQADIAKTNTVYEASVINFTHTFTYNKAMFLIEIKGKAGTNATMYMRLNIGGVSGVNEATIYSTTLTSTQLNDVNDVNVGVPVAIGVDMHGTGGLSYVLSGYQIINLAIIEYGNTANPLVTFDGGGYAYTLPAGQNGIVSSGGNPMNCLYKQSVLSSEYLEIEIDLLSTKTINGVSLDLFASNFDDVLFKLYVDNINVQNLGASSFVDNTWTSTGFLPNIFPINGQLVRVVFQPNSGNSVADMRLDNIEVIL